MGSTHRERQNGGKCESHRSQGEDKHTDVFYNCSLVKMTHNHIIYFRVQRFWDEYTHWIFGSFEWSGSFGPSFLHPPFPSLGPAVQNEKKKNSSRVRLGSHWSLLLSDWALYHHIDDLVTHFNQVVKNGIKKHNKNNGTSSSNLDPDLLFRTLNDTESALVFI